MIARLAGTGKGARFFRAFLLALAALLADLDAAALKLPFMDLGVDLRTTKPAYYRYEFVDFYVVARGARLHPKRDSILTVKIFRNGKEFPGLPYRPHAQLRWDANRETWRGRWPVPWNPPLGEYEAVLLRPGSGNRPVEHYSGPGEYEYSFAGEDQVLAKTKFTIRGKQAMRLPKGFGVVTLEPGRRPYHKFRNVDDERTGVAGILDWAAFMHADAFWHGVGMTSFWTAKRDEKNYPWIAGHLDMIDRMADHAHERGLKYGAYMLTFIVGGAYRLADYKFTTYYDKEGEALKSLRFISLTDQRRHRDVVALLKRLNENDKVDYIGFDYMRTDRGGLEFTDQFLADMDIRVSDRLRRGSLEDRQRWLGRLLAYDEEPELEDLWNWWRAHKVALVLKSMLEEAGVKKPTWVFSLSWEQGHHHGQDPFMMIDAGLSINAPMFYHANQWQFDQIVTQWRDYLQNGAGTFVVGEPVDYKLLVNNKGLTGPEEHYRRQQETLNIASKRNHQIGYFWHDMDRAASGSGYSTKEWAIAGAATFSLIREIDGAQPLGLEILSPRLTRQGVSFKVRVSNNSSKVMPRVTVQGLPAPGIGRYRGGSLTFYNLQPEKSSTQEWFAPWATRYLKKGRKDLRMLALKAKAPFEEVRHPTIVFRYVGDR